MDLECQPFDLRECVESAIDLLATKAAEKQLNLICAVDRDVPSAIDGDVTRLRQVLVNLLANAVKFTAEGEVVLSVRCAEEAPDSDRMAGEWSALHISVRDTGLGIPPDRHGPACFNRSARWTRPRHGVSAGRVWAWRSASAWSS